MNKSQRPLVVQAKGVHEVGKQVHVVGAVIVRGGTVLCAQRGPSGSLAGLWEFPGGKVELGETPRTALEREVFEELGCRIEVGDEVTTTHHRYDFATVSLTTFYSSIVEGEPKLSEHQAILWLGAKELDSVEWAPADVPSVEVVRGALS